MTPLLNSLGPDEWLAIAIGCAAVILLPALVIAGVTTACGWLLRIIKRRCGNSRSYPRKRHHPDRAGRRTCCRHRRRMGGHRNRNGEIKMITLLKVFLAPVASIACLLGVWVVAATLGAVTHPALTIVFLPALVLTLHFIIVRFLVGLPVDFIEALAVSPADVGREMEKSK